jgi:hypothetical protein
MGNTIMIPMQLLQSPKTTALVRRKSTVSLIVPMGKEFYYLLDFFDLYSISC